MTLWQLRRSLGYIFSRYMLMQSYGKAVARNGEWVFRFRIEDAVGRQLCKRGDYEPVLTDFVRQCAALKNGAVAFDIGANIGWYSVLLSRIMPSDARIYAFEPDPLNFRLLCENLKLNAAQNVVPVQKALAAQCGVMQLFQYAHKNTGRHSLLPINSDGCVEVETVTLDRFASEHGVNPRDVEFIKIDVEGFESEVFRGAQSILQAGPVILSEFAPEYMRQGGLDPAEYFELLAKHGYRASTFAGSKLVAAEFGELASNGRHTDLLLQRAA